MGRFGYVLSHLENRHALSFIIRKSRSAFYSEPNIKSFGDDIKWISRVPETIKAV